MVKIKSLLKNKKGISTLFIAIYIVLVAFVLISTIFIGIALSNSGIISYLRTQENRNQEQIVAGPTSLQFNEISNTFSSLLINNTGAITVRIRSIYIDEIFICDPSTFSNDSYIAPQGFLRIPLSNFKIYLNDTTMFGNWTVTTERGTTFSTIGINLLSSGTQYDTNNLYYGPLLLQFNNFQWSSDGKDWNSGWIIPESSTNVTWRIKVADIDTRQIILSSSSSFALVQNSQQSNKIASWDLGPSSLNPPGLKIYPDAPPVWLYFSLNGPNSLGYMNTPIPISSNFLTIIGNLVNSDGSLQGFAQTIPFEAVLVSGTPEIPTTITLNTISSPLTVQQPVTVSGQVTAATAVPSGSLVVIQYCPVGSQDWLNIINPQLTTSKTGSYTGTLTPPHAGTYQFRAVFMGATQGQTVWASSNSIAQTIVVNKASSTTTVAPITTTFGQSITATATVTPSFATGTITFQISSDNGTTYTQLGNPKTLVSGSATSDSYTPPAAGTNYRITASYSGDSDVLPSVSTPATLTVNKAQSTTSITLPSSPLLAGQSFTMTASVSPIAATGTVTFKVSTDNGNTYSIFSTVTLSSGTATSGSYTLLPLYSSYKFVAVYSGDNNVLTSTSSSASMSDLKFAVSGLDSSAQGTIVSVTVGSTPSVNVAFGDFTKDFGYVSSTTVVTYAFTSTVPSSNSGERFVLTTPAASPASGFSATGATTVTGTYKTQFQVSFAQTGITSDAGGNTVLTLGTSRYAYNALPSNVWVDKGTTFSWSTPVAGITGERFVYVSDSSLASPIVASGTDAAIYKTQYYLTVTSSSGTTSGQGWYDSGSTATISATAPSLVYSASQERYVFNGWAGSGSGSYIGTNNPASVTVNGPITETASWIHQYLLTVSTADFGTVSSGGWFNAGSVQSVAATAPSAGPGERYVWNSWTGSGSGSYSGTNNPASVTMNAPITETASWAHQYYLTVNNGGYGVASGSGWYNAGTTPAFSVSPTTVAGGAGVQYVFAAWSGDSSSASSSSSVLMNGPKTVTATWTTQYQLTFTTNFGTTSPSAGNYWYNAGSSVSISASSPSAVAGEQYVWNGWTGSGTGSYTGNTASPTVTMNGPITETASWTHQYYLTVNNGGYGTGGGEGWYDANTNAQATMTPLTVVGPTDTQYIFAGWTGDASGSTSPSNNILMDGPKTATATWTTQYLVTFVANGAGTTSPSGTNIWENAGSLAISATANAGYHFTSWTSSTGSTTFGDSTSASTTATISGPDTITANFDPNPVTHFSVVALASATAGTPFTVTVTALDASDTTITGYSGTIHFTSTDSQSGLPADYTFQASDLGVATFSVTLKTAGAQSITATDTGTPSITGGASVVVGPASATTLVVSASPLTVTAGGTVTVTVTAKDAYGNVVTGYAGTVDLSSSDPQAVSLPASSTLTNGVGSFSVTLETAGTQSITAGDGAITGSQTGITVNAAGLYSIVVSPTSATITAGNSQTFTAEGFDQYSNDLGSYTSSVTWSINSGTGTFIWTDNTVQVTKTGTWTVTATLGSVSGTASLTVNPGALDSFTISVPGSATAGSSFGNVVVGAYDAYGNLKTDYVGSVYFQSSDSSAVLPYTSSSEYTFTTGVGSDNGQHMFSGFTLKTVGSGSQTITVTDGAISKQSADITMNPAGASSFVVSAPASATAGTAFSVTVTALDPYGNVATGYTGTVHFTTSDTGSGVNLPADYTFVAGDNGVHAFADGFTLVTAASQTLTATDTVTSSITGTSGSVSVNPASVSTVTVTPSTATLGVGGQEVYTAIASDAFGNTWDVSGQVVWSIDSGAGGSWSGSTYTSAATGSWTVTATLGSVSGTASLTVT